MLRRVRDWTPSCGMLSRNTSGRPHMNLTCRSGRRKLTQGTISGIESGRQGHQMHARAVVENPSKRYSPAYRRVYNDLAWPTSIQTEFVIDRLVGRTLHNILQYRVRLCEYGPDGDMWEHLEQCP